MEGGELGEGFKAVAGVGAEEIEAAERAEDEGDGGLERGDADERPQD